MANQLLDTLAGCSVWLTIILLVVVVGALYLWVGLSLKVAIMLAVILIFIGVFLTVAI